MLKKNLFIILILLNFSLIAQNQIDSLKNLLLNTNIDVPSKLKILDQLYIYTYQTQPIQALEYAGDAVYLSDSLKNKSLSIKWKKRLAYLYYLQNKLDLSVKIFNEIKNYYQNKGDSLNYAHTLLFLGKIYAAMDVGEIALRNFHEAKRLFSKFNDTIDFITARNYIAKAYYDNYQAQKAFKILNENLQIAKKINNYKAIAQVNYYFAKIYADEMETDSAEYYYLQAIKYYKLFQNQDIKIADIYLEIAKMYIDDNNSAKANLYLNKALATFNTYNAKHKLAEVYLYIGKLYFLKKMYDKALKNYNLSLNIAEQYDISEIKQEIYYDLAQIFISKNNYKKAAQYLQMYIEERNSFFAKKREQGFAQVILLFQDQEKQKEIELLEKKEALKNQQLRNKQIFIYASVIIIVLLVIFIIYFIYSMQKLKQINKLLQEQNHKIKLQKKEIETQSRILEKATQDLLRQKQEIEEKNRKITASIKYASRIQKAMLPSESLFKEFFEDYFIFYKPKEAVSGDFYWLSEVKEKKMSLFKTEDTENQKIILAVVDCTGHGVPGAFMAMLGDAYLNQIINIQHIIEPSQILSQLHKQIRQTLQQEETDNNDGMDMALILIDKKERTIKFAGAKNPIVYIQNEKIYRIHGDLMSIGGLQKEKERIFVQHTIDITAPTWVYLYTDGFQDQFGGKYGRKYMAKPLRDFLFKIHKEPMSKQKELLDLELKRWMGKKFDQMDDITIIGIKL